MVDELWDASIFDERKEHAGIFPIQEEAEESTYEQGVDETAFDGEHSTKISQVASQEAFWCQKECRYISVSDSEEALLKREDDERNPRRKGAHDKENGINKESNNEGFAKMLFFEIGIETEEECHDDDLDPDAIGNPDIRRVPKESEEALDEPEQTIKFVKAPVIASAEDEAIDEWWCQNDEETEE